MDGVKVSGAPPPRKVIVQQCIRDKGVLEILCNYVSVCNSNWLFDYYLVMVHFNDCFPIGIPIEEV